MAIKNIIKSVFVILGFTVILKIIGFVMRVILSRTLGASALGVYQIALSFFGVICTVVASGIPVTISHISAKCGVNNDYRKEGMITGIGANMFKLTGSVIVFGVVSAYIFGMIRYIIGGIL